MTIHDPDFFRRVTYKSDYRRATYNPAQFIGTTTTLTGTRSPSGYECQVTIRTRGALDFTLWLRTEDIAEYIFGDDGEMQADYEADNHNDMGHWYERLARDNPKQVP